MNAIFFTEARFLSYNNSDYHSYDKSYSYKMFNRYLNSFDNIFIVARSFLYGKKDSLKEYPKVSAHRINILPLPFYIGPYEYIFKRKLLLRTLHNYIDSNLGAAIILRVPGVIGTAAGKYLIKKKVPYGVEVVGDPWDVFAPGSFRHPLRPLFRISATKNLKMVVQHAAAAIYVSKKTLQNRYPPAENAFSTYASNVMLPTKAFVPKAKTLTNSQHFSIVSIGSLAVMYKAPDIAIQALAILKQRHLRISLRWLGDGRCRPEMRALAEKVGVSDIISFVGNIASGEEIRAYLDDADLFVLPSRTEGVPRAIIEAMARGLPCIGTNIGGIPELLDEKALVPINDPNRLADKIEEFLTKPELANAQAKRNLLEAKNYASNILDTRRMEFYEYLKRVTQKGARTSFN